jgi:hypothetical protein
MERSEVSPEVPRGLRENLSWPTPRSSHGDRLGLLANDARRSDKFPPPCTPKRVWYSPKDKLPALQSPRFNGCSSFSRRIQPQSAAVPGAAQVPQSGDTPVPQLQFTPNVHPIKPAHSHLPGRVSEGGVPSARKNGEPATQPRHRSPDCPGGAKDVSFTLVHFDTEISF